MSDSISGRASLGVLLCGVGAVGLWASFGISTKGFVAAHDPGPRALPQIVSTLLMVGGGLEMILSWRKRRDSGASRPAAGGLRVPLAFVAGLVAYLLLLPRVGFLLLTPVFVTGLLLALGHRWWIAVAVAASMTAAVHLLFGILFRVQLPGLGLGG